MIRRAVATATAGSVVSTHRGHQGTVTAPPGVLKDLLDRGLTPVTAATLLLFVFELVLIARMLLDWVATGATTSGTAPGVARARTALRRVTEPVLAPLRRVLPPVRLAGVTLDLSVPALLLALIVLRSVLP